MTRCGRLVTGLSVGLVVSAAGQEAPPHTFRMILEQDTIASEVVVRTPTRVDLDLVFKLMGARWRCALTLTPDGRVAAMTDAFYRLAQGDTVPFQSADLAFGPDSLRITVSGNESRVQSLAVPPGAVPYINPSSTMLEQVLRRARALGHPVDTVPVFLLAGGQTVPVGVTWAGPDSAVLQFAGVEMRAAVAADGALLGWTVPAQRARVIRLDGAHPLIARKVDYGPPPGAPYTAEEVRVHTPAGLTLTGTLTLPTPHSKPVPAIVTITGSGPEDRDERLALVEGYRPFWQIADTLAQRGIATLRLDDRGVGGSDAGPSTATSADFADDVRAALAYLKTRPEIDAARLGLVGHSEGGMIAPMVAASDRSLRGIALMAGPAYNGRRILAFQQQNAVDKAPSLTPKERQEALEQSAKATEELATKSAWMRYFLDYDPLATARQVRVPVLILQGETDQQVTPEQADTLGIAFRAGGDRDVTVRRFAATNHLFLADPDGNPAGYSALRVRTVRPEVLGTLADWLARHLQ
jgi:dipeptidyl aminopeptidase/acylaminoacyl peptidase